MDIIKPLMQRSVWVRCVVPAGYKSVLRSLSSQTAKEEDTRLLEDAEDMQAKAKREEDIERKRNKSRLQPHHYNIQNDKVPYEEPMFSFHHSLKYKRRLYGKYGEASGVDPSLLWPSKAELADKKEYESVAYPMTIMEMVETIKESKGLEEQAKKNREKEILEKLKKVDQWTKEFETRAAKKLEEARVAKEKKDRLVEEVRRHFGYQIDPKDEKFKAMMEEKEKEAKKVRKEAKKKKRDEELLQKYSQAQPEPAKEK